MITRRELKIVVYLDIRFDGNKIMIYPICEMLHDLPRYFDNKITEDYKQYLLRRVQKEHMDLTDYDYKLSIRQVRKMVDVNYVTYGVDFL